jgi:hypothetical protein
MRTNTLVLGFVAMLAAGCSSAGHVTDVGGAVYNGAVTRIELDSAGGGFTAPPPAGAACDSRGPSSFSVTVAGHQLAWSYCAVAHDGTSAGDYQPSQGSCALGDAEWTGLQPALRGLLIVDHSGCGADKPSEELVVTTAEGDLAYGDGFYGCLEENKNRPVIKSEALEALGMALSTLARAGGR